MWLDGIRLNIKEEKTEKGHIASFIEPIKDFPFELTEDEISILDKVLEDWGFEATDELVGFTKSTLPWEESSFGKDIDLDAYVEECKLEDKFFSRKEVIEELDRIDKLKNAGENWRIRIGDYRAVYTIINDTKEVRVKKFTHSNKKEKIYN